MKEINIVFSGGLMVYGITDNGESVEPEITDELTELINAVNTYMDSVVTIQDMMIKVIEDKAEDEDLIALQQIFPEWKPGVLYAAGRVLNRRGGLIKVLQEHTSQEDWKPEEAPSLYIFIKQKNEDPEAPPEMWEDRWNMVPRVEGYMINDRVIYPEDEVMYIWRSKIGTPDEPNYHKPSSLAWAAWEREGEVLNG